MIFKDVSSSYNLAYRQLKDLEDFINGLEDILNIIEDCLSCTSKKTLECTSYNVQHSSDIINLFSKAVSEVKSNISVLNLFNVGLVLSELEHNIFTIKNENALEGINIFIDKTKDLIREIYSFSAKANVKVTGDSLFGLYSKINFYLNDVNTFKSQCTLLDKIQSSLENNIVLLDNPGFNSIELYYHNEDIGFEEMSKLIISINSLYENLCNLYNISTTTYKLQPIKVESGSFFSEIIGNEAVLELMKIILISVSTLCFTNLTRQGKFETSVKTAKDTIELVKLGKEAGLTVSSEDQEYLNSMLGKIISDANHLVCAGKLSVDGSDINIIESSQALLEHSKNKFLDQPKLSEEELASDVESDD